MSRSFKKHPKATICYGNNTPYYKLARRHLRQLNRQELRHLFANYDIEEISDRILHYQNKHDVKYDEWNEPTDGTYVVWHNRKGFFYWENDESFKEWVNKLKRK